MMNKWVRIAAFRKEFWQNYAESVAGFRFNRWSDDDSNWADYVGHPMMGAISSLIWIEHDRPKYRKVEFENTSSYWKSRMRGLAFSAAYSLQWKIGPISEASFGNTGQTYYYDQDVHRMTNGTGLVDLVVTPVGGLLWLLGEDAADRYLIRKLENRHESISERNPGLDSNFLYIGTTFRRARPFSFFSSRKRQN